MARNTGRTVYLRSDGRWANKSNDSLRVSGIHGLQTQAAAEARQMLQAAGGGELTLRNETGAVQCRESIRVAEVAPPTAPVSADVQSELNSNPQV